MLVLYFFFLQHCAKNILRSFIGCYTSSIDLVKFAVLFEGYWSWLVQIR